MPVNCEVVKSHRNGKRADRTMKETRQPTNPLHVCERERDPMTYKFILKDFKV